VNTRKIVIRAVLVVIGLPIVLVLLAFGFFYSVFYFPNWTSATTGTLVSSGEKREYLLYVPKSYDRAKPTPLDCLTAKGRSPIGPIATSFRGNILPS
jgi:poly(3-hydroxybutyrate) depolymerase